jgi:DNA-binding transcriptional LysR family regulator
MNESKRTARIDLNLFRVFEAIHRLGSLTQAARELHLTQPAVSNALARLRVQFGDPLFRRSGRRIVATPLAQTLAADVAQALHTLHGSLNRSQSFKPAETARHFVMGMRDSLEFTLLPALSETLLTQAPRLQLSCVGFERAQLPRLLGAGELSLAVDIPQPLGPGIRQQTLLTDPLCVLMRSGHPLSRAPLSPAAWLKARHVIFSARASGPALEDVALARRGLSRDVALRCQHPYAACHIAAHSDLLLTLPRFHARWFAAQLPLHIAEAPIPLPRMEVQMYWHQNAEEDPGNRWLRDALVEIATRGRNDPPARTRQSPRQR